MGAVGLGRGYFSHGGGAGTALDHLISTPLQYVRADVADITESSSRVSAWVDKVGSNNYSQGTGANQPLWLPTGGPGSKGAVHLDDTARFLDSSLTLPAPGTTPTLIYVVIKQVSYTVNRRVVMNSGDLSHLIYCSDTTPKLRGFNAGASAATTGATIGSWARVAVYFENSTSDFIQVGATAKSSGSALGNNTSADRRIGGDTAASPDIMYAEVLYAAPASAAAADADIAALDAYLDTYYGAGAVLT